MPTSHFRVLVLATFSLWVSDALARGGHGGSWPLMGDFLQVVSVIALSIGGYYLGVKTGFTGNISDVREPSTVQGVIFRIVCVLAAGFLFTAKVASVFGNGGYTIYFGFPIGAVFVGAIDGYEQSP